MTTEEIIEKADKQLDYGSFKKARAIYETAITSLQTPHKEQPLYLEIMTAIGDTLLHEAKNREALKLYKKLIKHPEAETNGYLHLRLGQVALTTKDLELAKVELPLALKLGGDELFEDEYDDFYQFAVENRVEE
jgi:tetratricopeptide (TPR) repeat protein